MQIKRILAPTDFSDNARVATQLAMGLARAHGAEVKLFYALDPYEHLSPPESVRESYKREQTQRAERDLAELKQTLQDIAGTDVPVSTLVRLGPPVSVAYSEIRSWNPDLVVVGTHGANANERFFGSVALRIARSAACPVLVARQHPDMQIPKSGLFRRPLVAIDYSRFSRVAAETAATLTEQGSQIELVHVIGSPDVDEHQEFADPLAQARDADLSKLQDFVADVDVATVQVSYRSEVGRVAEQVLGYADTSKTDLIVVGAHGCDYATEVIGTIADRILRSAKVPVVVIPDAAVRPI